MTQHLVLLVLGVFLALAPLLFHEMGHWAVLRRMGVPVREYWLGLGPALLHVGRLRVGMLPLGGAVVPEPEPYKALTPRQRAWVALAGPAASVIYGWMSLGVWYALRDGGHAKVLYLIALSNFAIAFVNLLPIPPLDGFQALCNWLEHARRPLSARAMGLAHRAGNGLVFGFGFLLLAAVLFR